VGVKLQYKRQVYYNAVAQLIQTWTDVGSREQLLENLSVKEVKQFVLGVTYFQFPIPVCFCGTVMVQVKPLRTLASSP